MSRTGDITTNCRRPARTLPDDISDVYYSAWKSEKLNQNLYAEAEHSCPWWGSAYAGEVSIRIPIGDQGPHP